MKIATYSMILVYVGTFILFILHKGNSVDKNEQKTKQTRPTEKQLDEFELNSSLRDTTMERKIIKY